MNINKLLEVGEAEKIDDMAYKAYWILQNYDEKIEYGKGIKELIDWAKTRDDLEVIKDSNFNPYYGGQFRVIFSNGVEFVENYFEIVGENGIVVLEKGFPNAFAHLIHANRNKITVDGKPYYLGKSYEFAEEFYGQIKNDPVILKQKEELPIAEYCSRKLK